MNYATKVVEYLSEDVDQVNCEMHYLSGAIKYDFGILDNTRSTIEVDESGLRINVSNSKRKRISDIFTPGGSFPQGKEIIQNLISI